MSGRRPAPRRVGRRGDAARTLADSPTCSTSCAPRASSSTSATTSTTAPTPTSSLWSPAVRRRQRRAGRGAPSAAHACSVARRALGRTGAPHRVIGLTGTHGKTTATSMMVHVLAAAGRDAGAAARRRRAGRRRERATGARRARPRGRRELRDVRAARARTPCGLLNVEADHLDHYGTLDALEGAFAALVERTAGPVVVWVDDDGARRVAAARASRRRSRRAPARRRAWRVSDVARRRAAGRTSRCAGRRRAATAPGCRRRHNVADAAVVAVLALVDGVGASDGRRRARQLQRRAAALRAARPWRGVDVYEDYAHLPGEIDATLAAPARRRLRAHHRGLPAPSRDAHARAGRAVRAGLRRRRARRGHRHLRRRRGQSRTASRARSSADPLRARRGAAVTYCAAARGRRRRARALGARQ